MAMILNMHALEMGEFITYLNMMIQDTNILYVLQECLECLIKARIKALKIYQLLRNDRMCNKVILFKVTFIVLVLHKSQRVLQSMVVGFYMCTIYNAPYPSSMTIME